MLQTVPELFADPPILRELAARLGKDSFSEQKTVDGIPTIWVAPERLLQTLNVLKNDVPHPYRMLFDLTAIDERSRTHREGQPAADFAAVYHLLSFGRNEDFRLKVALAGSAPHLPSICKLWPNANWYEREVWDMFGIVFDGHPHLARILTPPSWTGHPLRKEHYARATEMGVYELTEDKEIAEQEALRFRPEEWGMTRRSETSDFMFLNMGPNHPSVHGVFRLILQLEGEEIIDACRKSAFIIAARRRWASGNPGTPSSPIPTASTISAA